MIQNIFLPCCHLYAVFIICIILRYIKIFLIIDFYLGAPLLISFNSTTPIMSWVILLKQSVGEHRWLPRRLGHLWNIWRIILTSSESDFNGIFTLYYAWVKFILIKIQPHSHTFPPQLSNTAAIVVLTFLNFSSFLCIIHWNILECHDFIASSVLIRSELAGICLTLPRILFLSRFLANNWLKIDWNIVWMIGNKIDWSLILPHN